MRIMPHAGDCLLSADQLAFSNAKLEHKLPLLIGEAALWGRNTEVYP